MVYTTLKESNIMGSTKACIRKAEGIKSNIEMANTNIKSPLFIIL
jgi:hypothetical protein